MWLTGKYIGECDGEGNGICWELIGVFSSEEKAVAACLNEYYFIGPVELDEVLPDETVEWPGCYYPKELK
jgi:hypothetical protein